MMKTAMTTTKDIVSKFAELPEDQRQGLVADALQATAGIPGCFANWLKAVNPQAVPMTNGHGGAKVGVWLHIGVDNLGLRVVGQIQEESLLPLSPIKSGLSVKPTNTQGPPTMTPQGGAYVRITDISEIALVPNPKQPLARICGDWPWF